jgi:HlyD family secretion protein
MKLRQHRRKSVAVAVLFSFSLLCSSCRTASVHATEGDVPSATAQQADIQLRFLADGSLKATQSRIITAPPVAGGALRIIRLAHTGAAVHKDEIVLEFDPTQQEYNLAQSRSDVAQAEQEIVKARADAEVQAAEDTTALLKARYAVRRAELDVSKNELLSEIDAKKNDLALEEARRALAQLVTDIQSHSTSNKATLAVSEEKRNKAHLAMQQAEQNIQNMKVKAPLNGIVLVHGNENSTGGMFWGGMALPEYHVGDTANPGNTVAEVIDISEMEITAQVSERDRPFIKSGQVVEVSMDAFSNKPFTGKVVNVAGATGQGFFFDNLQRKFGVTIHLDHADSLLRPGFTARLVFLGDQLPRALSIPGEAVFEQSGKTVAYLRNGSSWQPQEIRVLAYSEGRAIVSSGISAGAQVALVNPENRSTTKSKSNQASSPPLPGGAT